MSDDEPKRPRLEVAKSEYPLLLLPTNILPYVGVEVMPVPPWLTAKVPEIVESVEVAAAYTLPLASTARPLLVRPVMWRLVVVALVVDALVANSEVKICC